MATATVSANSTITTESMSQLLDLYTKLIKSRFTRPSPGSDESAIKKGKLETLRHIDCLLAGALGVRLEQTLGHLSRPEQHIFFATLCSKLMGVSNSPRYGLPCGAEILTGLVECKDALSLVQYLLPDGLLIRSGLVIAVDPDEPSVLDRHYSVADDVLIAVQRGTSIAKQQDQTMVRRCGAGELTTPRFTMKDVVLPQSIVDRVRTVLTQHKKADRLDEWFGETISYGRGATILLFGPPGTGKTLLAEAIASEVNSPLLKADYPSLVNKYVGETSKGISGLFKSATAEKAVLLLDECDSLLSARISSPSNGTDHYINQECAVLLQQIENFDGVLILTSNLASNLDGAVDRRIQAKIEIPMPGENERAQIWQNHLAKIPGASEIDTGLLAAKFPLSGGLIKNSVLHAASRAILRADESLGEPSIRLEDLEEGARLAVADYREDSSNSRHIGFLAN